MFRIFTVVLGLLMLSVSTHGQLPNARFHAKFLDKTNIVLLGATTGLIVWDSVQTRQIQAHHGGESNPLARPFVTRGWGGQMAGSVISLTSCIALSYLFHRTRHHKLERAVPMVLIGTEIGAITSNVFTLEHWK
jgi:hypothetical protein